jgi:hypothetical protein
MRFGCRAQQASLTSEIVQNFILAERSQLTVRATSRRDDNIRGSSVTCASAARLRGGRIRTRFDFRALSEKQLDSDSSNMKRATATMYDRQRQCVIHNQRDIATPIQERRCSRNDERRRASRGRLHP